VEGFARPAKLVLVPHMLNDLLTVERGLAACGIGLVGRHPDVKDMAKGWALRVRLHVEGYFASLEIVQEAGRGALWTLRDGQHNGFPGLKTAAGLLALDDLAREAHSKAWDEAKSSTSQRNELLRLLASYSVHRSRESAWPSAGHRKRIAERLDELRMLANDPCTAAVPAAFERFLAALDVSPPFLEALAASLEERVRNGGGEWLDPARIALIAPVALAIDVAEPDFPRDAGDPRQIGPVSAALSSDPGNDSEVSGSGALCALSGQAVKLLKGNFPQPNLPGLGQTYIFSRNRDIPSLSRYGRTADASFPIGSDLARRLSGAITELTREAAEGKTWRLIPAESGDKSDLLVVSMNDPDLRLTDALEDEQVDGEAALKELGSRIIDHMRGLLKRTQPEDEVNVLVLRTVDPANRKVIYHRRTTSAKLWQAARHWQAGVSNVPTWLCFPVPGKAKTEVVRQHAPYVAPLSITSLSRIHFVNGGQRRVKVIGVSAATAFSLFLREGNAQKCAHDLLRLLVRRHGALLSGLAATRFKGIEHLKSFDPRADLRRDALRSITWIGALLHHLGRLKARTSEMPEVISYTEDLAFRLGQFLAAVDLIHIGYCADMRNGSVPPTLIGNSVFSIAGSDPTRALSILQSRLKPYLGWARRADTIRAKAEEEERRGNKGRAIALRQGLSQARRANDVVKDLHRMLGLHNSNRRKPDDVFKAELLLGYVAGLPPVPKGIEEAPGKTADTSNDQDEEQAT
jgi:hypothetical protein